jgi:hypothetical protein
MKSAASLVRLSVVTLFLLVGLSAGYGATWTGAVSTDWATAGNWSPIVPGPSTDAVIPTAPTGGRFPTISSGTLEVHQLIIRNGATVTQTGGTITIHDLIIEPGGTYNQQGGYIYFEHDWRNNGTFTATAGTVEFTGNASGAGGDFFGVNQFFNVVVDAGVDPRFDRNSGTSISIAGDFVNNNATLDNNTNVTFTFNGSSNQVVYSASTKSTFGNLVVDKASGAVTLSSALVVSGNVTINDGSLNLGTNLLSRATYGGALTLNGDSVMIVGGPLPTNFANVTVAPGAAIQYSDVVRLAISSANGSCRVIGTGTPGRSYRLQCADSLTTPNWQDIAGSFTADTNGVFQCTGTIVGQLRFYRAVYP